MMLNINVHVDNYLVFFIHNPFQDSNNQIIVDFVVIHCTERKNGTFTVIYEEQSIHQAGRIF